MLKRAILICLMLSCTDEERASDVLAKSGYTDIDINGYGFNKCSKDDSTCTSFTALSPAHVRVTGAVGCGRVEGCGKGCTIRVD